MSDYLEVDGPYATFVESRISPNVTHDEKLRLLHIGLGLVTEAGEFADPLKKMLTKALHWDQLDFVNLDEEIGDLLFYIQEYCNFRGTSMREIAWKNEYKLTKRYPQGFTAERSDNRDLDAERKVLEDNGIFGMDVDEVARRLLG